MWLLVVAMSAMILMYLLTNLADARTSQLYAEAHLVGAKSDARTDLLAAALPYVGMVLGIGLIVGAVVLIVVIVIGGVMAIIALMRYFEHREQMHMALAQSQQPQTTIVLQIVGSSRQAYKWTANFQKTLPGQIIDVDSYK